MEGRNIQRDDETLAHRSTRRHGDSLSLRPQNPTAPSGCLQAANHVHDVIHLMLLEIPLQPRADLCRDAGAVDDCRLQRDGPRTGNKKLHRVLGRGNPTHPDDGNLAVAGDLHTMCTAIGRIAGPDSPPVPAPSMGRRVSMSMARPTRVLISDSASAPASAAARAIDTMSVTFGVSLTNRGRVHTARTAATTSLVSCGSTPKMRPRSTLGQDTLSSTAATPSSRLSHSASVTNSRTVSPAMLTISGMRSVRRNGRSFVTKPASPWLGRPCEFSHPPTVGTTWGYGWPGRGSSVTDFVTNAAKLGRSTTLCTSRPKPSGPGAARTGWANLMPATSTDNDGIRDSGCGIRIAGLTRSPVVIASAAKRSPLNRRLLRPSRACNDRRWLPQHPEHSALYACASTGSSLYLISPPTIVITAFP